MAARRSKIATLLLCAIAAALVLLLVAARPAWAVPVEDAAHSVSDVDSSEPAAFGLSDDVEDWAEDARELAERSGASSLEPEEDAAQRLSTEDEPSELDKRACVPNKAAGRCLASTINAAGVASIVVDAGSANGLWAFILSDGNPRIVYYSGTSRVVRWNSTILLKTAAGKCSAWVNRFQFYGDIDFWCYGLKWSSIRVINGYKRPRSYTIDNSGVVRFYQLGNRVPILTISPGTGPNPRTAWTIFYNVVKTTTIRATSTRTTSTKYLTPTALPPRDPLLQPFAHYSIWNLPIGDAAVTVPFGMQRPNSWQVDTELLFLDSAAPVTPVFYNGDGWSGGSRCSANYSKVVARVPVPTDFAGKPARTDWRPNGSSAFIGADNMTVVMMQPVTRCGDSTKPVTAMGKSDLRVNIYGGGRSGGHGGSLLSSFGGNLRTHEFTTATYPDFPRHALKININARLYYYKGDAQTWRWPSRVGEAFVDRQGTNPYVKSGSLLVLPRTFDPETMRSNPGKMIANTLRAYGMYVVDDANSNSTYLSVEVSYGLKPEMPATGKNTDFNNWMPLQGGRDFNRMFTNQFAERFFTQQFTTNKNCAAYTYYLEVPTKNWCLDILDIYNNLHVVVNWDAQQYWDMVSDPNNYNMVGIGGGKPLSPWASKIQEDPWLQPCLDVGTRNCTSRGLQYDTNKDCAWQKCLFETQLNCYLQ